ncbi:hypothetical protein LXA43DRAFT_398971 [Ganoderma leucocontextum]|nr:hypothetical protein LXA43DRAFT_398971 [Ganoderma leucocontextum]
MPDNLDSWFREHHFRHRLLARERRDRHPLRHQCSYCGKVSELNLQHCSLCKSVRYCGKRCQINHYRNGHKQDCRDFKQPPITAFFLTEPLRDKKYAPHPIFGHVHNEGLGMWVSVDGPIDCELRPLALPLRPPTSAHDIEDRRKKCQEDPGTASHYKAHANHLLTLHILVQNRSKAPEPVMVFGAFTVVRSLVEQTGKMMGGYLGTMARDDCLVNERGIARCGPAHDPFTEHPRLFIKNFNGHEIRDNAYVPSAVVSAEMGIFLLHRGDFAVLQIQFRLGNGALFRREFEALSFIDNVSIPIAPDIKPSWVENPDSLRYLATKLSAELSTTFCAGHRVPQGLCALIDHEAVSMYYLDYLNHGTTYRDGPGKRAFARSHYGQEQAERWEQLCRNAETSRLDARRTSTRQA